jgi:hypothetical protein
VNDFPFLIQFGLATTCIVAPVVLLNRLIAGSAGGALSDLFAIPVDPPWPRGVQEEEPVRWRVELLHRRTPSRAACAGVQRDAMLPVNRSMP